MYPDSFPIADQPTIHDRFVNRRRLLQTAGAGFGGLALQHLLGQEGRLRAAAPGNPLAARLPHFAARAKSVIFMKFTDFMETTPQNHQYSLGNIGVSAIC